MAQAKWSRTKTLSRNAEFRPIEVDDVKYAWAAYRAGELEGFEPGLEAVEFRDLFKSLILSRFDAAWTLISDTKRGRVPIGFALGFYPHPDASGFLFIDTMLWFSWATARNRIESAAKFFDDVRKEIPMLGFAKIEHKKFYEALAKMGILRRVGTTVNVFPGESASIWETRGS